MERRKPQGKAGAGVGRGEKRKVEEGRRVQGYVGCIHASPLQAELVSGSVSQLANITGWGGWRGHPGP